ncbi:tripartite tricarboxylate transporter substrate binding protein [Bordetella sp. BOR01]|uniref:Bug family tripartite tricarboxylate transporter substrate binding protein n=1 Tax=Bordetella sp. BOR01 TaxID=2854779 RepID=UPI001C465F35|nr:tripartite tricarboxylate transporter substrate-binding protein [Bordetella sp. BOR01]MBV7483317.1 tripartite tricarboxylate transporter substrate binding protein [Bordetella sp. BOR01]
MERRQMLAALIALGASASLGAARASASGVPLHVIVPFPPGGGTDVLGRALGFRLEQQMSRTAVVENKPGASGIVGAEYVAKSAPDGNTLLFSGLVPSVRYYSRPLSQIDDELKPVCMIARSPYLVAVNPGVPAKTLQELVQLAERSPGELTFGSPGNATPQHLATERFRSQVGIDMLHVPYRGTGPMMTDLLGGQIQVVFATVAAAEQHVKSGRLRALAVTSAGRLERLPDVPTADEAGFAGFEAEIAFGTYVAAGTADEVVADLNRAINQALTDADVRGKLVEQGFVPVGGTPGNLEKSLVAEVKAISELVQSGRVSIDAA